MYSPRPSQGDNPAYDINDINDKGQIIGQTLRGEPGAWIRSAVLWESHDDPVEPACSPPTNSTALAERRLA